jgi:hypothetical protein
MIWIYPAVSELREQMNFNLGQGKGFEGNKDCYMACFSVDCPEFSPLDLLLGMGKHSSPKPVALSSS